MIRTSTLSRAFAAALAIAAFSAQAAGAQSRQDLRSPDTRAAAVESQSPGRTCAPRRPGGRRRVAVPTGPALPDRRPGPVSTAAPLTAQQPNEVRAPSGADDSTPWAAIGIGLAGIGVLLTGTVAIMKRTRRRARVAMWAHRARPEEGDPPPAGAGRPSRRGRLV